MWRVDHGPAAAVGADVLGITPPTRQQPLHGHGRGAITAPGHSHERTGADMTSLDQQPSTTVVDPIVLRRSPWEWIIDYNPFYLLSGAAMLLGCFLLNRALTQADPDRFDWLVKLLVVFNLYELVVIALGIWLARKLQIMRHALVLLVLEVLLLSDLTLLFHRSFTFNEFNGLWVCAPAWVLALAKLAVIFCGMNIRLLPRGWAILALDLAALLLLGGVWRALVKANLFHADQLYLGWWLLALLIGLRGIRWTEHETPRGDPARILLTAARYVPLTSVTLHLWATHWVFKGTDLHAYDLAPMLIGLGGLLMIKHKDPQWSIERRIALLGTGIAALALSAGGPVWFNAGYWSITPLRLMLLADAGLWTTAWWINGSHLLLLPAGVLSFLMSALGHNLCVIFDRLRTLGDKSTPDSAAGWGWSAVACAFVMLAAGAALSWLTHRSQMDRN
ncbi:MAG: hypothetical protein IT445_09335 [Phycisphaeraceae bacterium]|nr:hypothetical protein [Phycisphaeraceae bacterium]